MKLNKKKAEEKLSHLSWEELDWLEQRCRSLKGNSDGPRMFSSSGDATHRAEGARQFASFFENSWEKHHGG